MKLSIMDADVEALPGTTYYSRTCSSATQDPEIVSSSTTMTPVTTLLEETYISSSKEGAPCDKTKPEDISPVVDIGENNRLIDETKQDENKEVSLLKKLLPIIPKNLLLFGKCV